MFKVLCVCEPFFPPKGLYWLLILRDSVYSEEGCLEYIPPW